MRFSQADRVPQAPGRVDVLKQQVTELPWQREHLDRVRDNYYAMSMAKRVLGVNMHVGRSHAPARCGVWIVARSPGRRILLLYHRQRWYICNYLKKFNNEFLLKNPAGEAKDNVFQ
jgi:hypothetical protein